MYSRPTRSKPDFLYAPLLYMHQKKKLQPIMQTPQSSDRDKQYNKSHANTPYPPRERTPLFQLSRSEPFALVLSCGWAKEAQDH